MEEKFHSKTEKEIGFDVPISKAQLQKLLDRAREEGREEIRQLLRDKKQVQEFLKENPKFYKGKKIETAGIATLTKF